MLLIQQVTALAGRDFSPETVMREMLHLLSELLGLNRGRIVLLDESGQSSRIRYAYGLTADEFSRGRYAPDEGVTGRVLARGQLIIVQDIDNDPLFLGRMVALTNLPSVPVSYIDFPNIRRAWCRDTVLQIF